MSLIQVSFGFVGDQVDEVEALLLEIEKPNWNIYRDQDTQSAYVNGIFETELEALLEWERMSPAFREVLGNVEPRFGLLADEDWKYAYQNHFQAWTFQRMHWVPEWERETYEVPDGEAVVWLDPGMAFGSGNHETTRLCIERLMEYLEITRGNHRSIRRLSLCDAGCGSGILAISARILGIENVVGFDNDPNSVRVSQSNAELNSLNNKIEFYEGDLETGFRGKTYHLVIANLLSAVLARFPHELLRAVTPTGRLILSGILSIELRGLRNDFERQLDRMGREATLTSRQLGEWSDLVIDLRPG